MRYRFYRVHKYVCFVLSEFERLVAKTDFSDIGKVENLKIQLGAVHDLMHGHADHEDKAIHALLREKGSTVHQLIESDHQDHEKQFNELTQALDEITASADPQLRISRGYQFYVAYRLFVSDNLQHIHLEETVIMPELHRLCTDEELRRVDKHTYSIMTPEQMLHMLEVISPHMDPNDIASFLANIKDFEPEKFAIISKEL